MNNSKNSYEKQKDNIIILRITPSREKDRIFTVLSSDRGKISLFGRGIEGGKLSPFMQWFNYVQVEFIEGNFLPVITGAEIIEEYQNDSIANWYGKNLVAELIESLIPERQAIGVEFFEEIRRFFKSKGSIVSSLLFIQTLLAREGYGVNSTYCSRCGNRITGTTYVKRTNIIGEECRTYGDLVLTERKKEILTNLQGNYEEELNMTKEELNWYIGFLQSELDNCLDKRLVTWRKTIQYAL